MTARFLAHRVVRCLQRCMGRQGLVLICGMAVAASAWSAERRLLIAPQQTDARLAESDAPHLVVYDPDAAPASPLHPAPLLVWLPGTGGAPATGPRHFFDTALRQGYRVIGVSYITTQAVSQVCRERVVRMQPRCAEQFRQHRVWGEPQSTWVGDRPEDAIVPRLTRLLQHLARTDTEGQWAAYLEGGEPRWARIVLAGQSQGGGMAAYLAQDREVAGVIAFSGGWDHGAAGGMAAWYARPSRTPAPRWHGTYHVDEVQASTMQRIYEQLGIPAANIHALNETVLGRSAHGEGISNPAYKPLWERMLRPPPL